MYPPDQNFKIRYPSVIQIFKISVSVSVRIHAHERTNGSIGLVGRVGFHGFLPTPSVVSVIFGAGDRKQERKKTLFYTMRSEQLLPQTGELLFIPLANLPV